ncbi:MAG: hypothetical protein ABWZ01_00095, partial [Methyloceanibacter sp.]
NHGQALPVRRTRLVEHKGGLYRTPVEAVLALERIELEWLPKRIWEPACGDGAIVLPLRRLGYDVKATDLVDRGCPDSIARFDFLLGLHQPMPGIVTNPPYRLAHAFAVQALNHANYVAFLLPLSFLAGQERRAWHIGSPLARVWVSSRRLPMMHRDGWEGPRATSQTDHAWFVWDKRHKGKPQVLWFDYEHL